MNDVTKDLLEAMKRAKGKLVAFKFIPGEANRWEESDEEALAAIDSAIARAEAALAEPQPDAESAMTRADVLRLALEAGFTWEPINNIADPLERFAGLVASAERKACIAITKDAALTLIRGTTTYADLAARGMATHLIDAIRARGQK